MLQDRSHFLDSGSMTPLCLLLLYTSGSTLHYTGGLLGVSADVTLFTQQSRAAIRLQGIPVGGVLEGGASYDADYKVMLDGPLTARLKRLRVRVVAVTPSPEWDHVYVTVRLPLFLGTHTIGLAKNGALSSRTMC